MAQLEISAQPRTVFGKKVRFLRRRGQVPANVFGHGVASYAIQADAKQLSHTLSQAGTSKLIAIHLPAEREARRVLVREVARDPRTHELLHVNFYQVRMTERLKAEVPLNYVGESPAVESGQGTLLRSLTHVEVECLPGNLPEAITVNVSSLQNVDDAIHVRDLKAPVGVTILTDADEQVAKVLPMKVEKEEVVEKPEAAEAAAEAAGAAPEATEEESE